MKKRTSWGLLLVSVLLALSLFTSCGIDDLINLPDDTTQIKTTTAESADVSATITENAID